ncbi:glutamine amidotransferase-related protein [Flexithrix dorotheae]|uniref:glutamine amidotransferase-related protein n=1 Tax=Flexithrix dorotheae TaxID=70993 RepID=UPI00037EF469|nr:hypothetical protein [Flexithrix dorotheae]
MDEKIKIGIIAQYNHDFLHHIYVEKAISDSFGILGVDYRTTWISANEINDPVELNQFDAIWVPSSENKVDENLLNLLKFIREKNIPMLATAMGMKQMVWEFARNAVKAPANFENFITETDIPQEYQTVSVKIIPNTIANLSYKKNSIFKQDNSTFEINANLYPFLSEKGLILSGNDEKGRIKILEYLKNDFYVGVLYVPQLNSTPDNPSKIITMFLKTGIRHYLQKQEVVVK